MRMLTEREVLRPSKVGVTYTELRKDRSGAKPRVVGRPESLGRIFRSKN